MCQCTFLTSTSLDYTGSVGWQHFSAPQLFSEVTQSGESRSRETRMHQGSLLATTPGLRRWVRITPKWPQITDTYITVGSVDQIISNRFRLITVINFNSCEFSKLFLACRISAVNRALAFVTVLKDNIETWM